MYWLKPRTIHPWSRASGLGPGSAGLGVACSCVRGPLVQEGSTRMSTVDQLTARAVRWRGHWVLVVLQAGLGVFPGQRATGLLGEDEGATPTTFYWLESHRAAQMREGAATSRRGGRRDTLRRPMSREGRPIVTFLHLLRTGKLSQSDHPMRSTTLIPILHTRKRRLTG